MMLVNKSVIYLLATEVLKIDCETGTDSSFGLLKIRIKI